jgi:hypothetical protein
MKSVSFLNVITYILNTYCVMVHCPYPIYEESFKL